MIALFVVVALAVVGGVAVLVARDRPLLEDDPVGTRPLRWPGAPAVDSRDLAEVRFPVVLRGYRMDQVDGVLDDARAALSERDARIADLQRVVAALGSGRLDPGDQDVSPGGALSPSGRDAVQ